MSLACTHMSFGCHSYVLVCHPYVTLTFWYVTRMSLVCGFTMNLDIDTDTIIKLIRSLDSNKAHDRDGISIR